MKVLTQKQAAKMFPERKYEEYDPMILIAGTPTEFKKTKLESRMKITVGGKTFKLLPNERTGIDALCCFGECIFLDVDRPGDMRLVIWKRPQ